MDRSDCSICAFPYRSRCRRQACRDSGRDHADLHARVLLGRERLLDYRRADELVEQIRRRQQDQSQATMPGPTSVRISWPPHCCRGSRPAGAGSGRLANRHRPSHSRLDRLLWWRQFLASGSPRRRRGGQTNCRVVSVLLTGRAILMPSTPAAYPQVVSCRFAYSRVD